MKKGMMLLISCLSISSYADINHQVDLGFTDLSGLDKAFLGARYRYFSDDLNALSGPQELKSHLHRVSNVAIGGFANDNLYYITSDATYYWQHGVILAAGVQHVDDDSGIWQSDSSLLNASIGNQINDQLQIGLTAFYSRVEETSHFYPNEELTSVEWSYAPYIRWTNINNNQGWDIEAKQLAGRYRYIQGRAAYYVNQDWSVGVVANVHGRGDRDDNYEIQTQYWFNEHIALKFGLGSSLKSDDGLNSATLLLNTRW